MELLAINMLRVNRGEESFEKREKKSNCYDSDYWRRLCGIFCSYVHAI